MIEDWENEQFEQTIKFLTQKFCQFLLKFVGIVLFIYL